MSQGKRTFDFVEPIGPRVLLRKDEAKRTIAFLEELGDAYEQELEQLSTSKIE